MILEIYTDASGNINTKSEKGFGYSAVFQYEGVEYFSSYKITQTELVDLLNSTEDVSNPTVEVFAVENILSKFSENSKILPKLTIKVFSDYKGVSAWFNKEWAMNKPYIRTLIRLCRKWSETLIQDGHQVSVHWIKGHNGNEGNEKADKLAVERLNKTNIPEFFNLFKK